MLYLAVSILLALAAEAQKLPNLVELANELNLTRFVQELKKSKVDRTINHEGTKT